MNAAQLAQDAYSASRTSIRTDRSIEYEVFARITQNIKSSQSAGKTGFAALASALHENRKLWRILAADVAENDNALPETLRARIFYLAEFTNQHTSKVLAGTASAAALIEINTCVMRGLRNQAKVAP